MTRAAHVSTITLATFALLWFAAPQVDAQTRRSYPDRGPWSGYGYAARSGPGFQFGLDDGYREGLDAARDGRRYDPYRERRYRNADRGYNRHFGPRGLYRQDYRDGFRAGYERGYREARRRYWNRPYRW